MNRTAPSQNAQVPSNSTMPPGAGTVEVDDMASEPRVECPPGLPFPSPFLDMICGWPGEVPAAADPDE